MRDIVLGEFFGTMILILLGSGVVANVSLNKSGQKGGGSIQITIAWGLAVMIPACIFGSLTGAHFNPALTIALALNGSIEWASVPFYILGQIPGAFCGAVLVYILYKDHYDATSDNPELVRGTFCTAPSIPNTFRNLLSEIIGTFVLVFAIIGFGNVDGAGMAGVDKIFVYGLIVSIGMSLGGLTGYAINPARDLGPRIAFAVLPFKNKTDPNWGYAWIPVVGPIIGAIIAVIVYNFIF
ncbi:aquaporin family protein [Anaerococcus sp. AGMB00486]|uniref:Aquaporin family protein n=2 Tax=Anaerococcus TaxID=165779 RepID=A0ABX2NBL4_9FIRM|nr:MULTISPECIES: MIP/aquaporin family protein [Anaerococcus]MDY3006661.1 MIP/aquaporin family protein [Anaerococcus porci]MSS78128.1 aquaporin family protein [Anaerococcus porci]NVF12068.1 aquaporin family protein [Anaerococcus faecalis]